MSIIIKNIDTVSAIYAGQTILAGESYIAKEGEYSRFKSSNLLINNLTLESPLVSINSLTGSDGVGELFQVKSSVIVGGPKVYDEGFCFTATFGTDTVYDHKFTSPVQISSGFMESEGNHVKDSITLQLVDVDGVVYPAGTILHTYVKKYPVKRNGSTEIANDAITETSLQHFYVRVTYHSTGNSDVDCNCGINGRLP